MNERTLNMSPTSPPSRDVSTLSDSQVAEMQQYQITFDGGKFRFLDYSYDKLQDAINYANRQTKDNPLASNFLSTISSVADDTNPGYSEPQDTLPKMYCSQCGAHAPVNAMFCVKCGAAINNAEVTHPTVTYEQSLSSVDESSSTQLATRGVRLAAVILDSLIFLVVLMPGVFVIMNDQLFEVMIRSKDFGLILLLLGWLTIGVAQLVFLVLYGQTLGKSALEIKIVNASDGGIPGFWVISVREFIRALAVIPFIGLIDALFILRDDRCCLHDLIAQTKVVKA